MRHKKYEFSKKLLIASYVIAAAITVTVITLAVVGVDITGLDGIALAAWGEVTATNGFYLMKAKRENKAKYAQQFVKDMADRYGIEHVTGILGIVLQD